MMVDLSTQVEYYCATRWLHTRERKMTMSVHKRGGHWHFTKTIDGVRYRGALKTARTKAQAEEAERAIILKVHQGTYDICQAKQTLGEFVEKTYLPWAKVNKRSWKIDSSRLKPLCE